MSESHLPVITAAEFARARPRVAEILTAIRRKYPTLKPRAVLTILPDQCDLDSDPETILRNCPALLLENLAKRELRGLPELPEDPPPEARLARQMRVDELSAQLLYRGDSLVELRFGHLDYPKIWELQTDELVDRERTPVSQASIRVVLGQLLKFANQNLQ